MDIRIRSIYDRERGEVCHAANPYHAAGLPDQPAICGKPAQFRLLRYKGGNAHWFNYVCEECLSPVIDGLVHGLVPMKGEEANG